MIAVDKVEKTHLKFLISLWQGQVTVALSQDSGESEKSEKWSELMVIWKSISQRINYNRRRLVGKTIGSGRMEKVEPNVDVVRRRKL